MPGEAAEPQTTVENVYQVARTGSGTWRVDNQGGTWQLTRDDLLAVESSWEGDVNELSPLAAQTIAASRDAECPWRRPENHTR